MGCDEMFQRQALAVMMDLVANQRGEDEEVIANVSPSELFKVVADGEWGFRKFRRNEVKGRSAAAPRTSGAWWGGPVQVRCSGR